jgi:hypothetical protein
MPHPVIASSREVVDLCDTFTHGIQVPFLPFKRELQVHPTILWLARAPVCQGELTMSLRTTYGRLALYFDEPVVTFA